MTTTFIFTQDINLGCKVSMWSNRTWLSQYLTALYFFTFCTAQQDTNVIACLTLVEQFTEHFNTSTGSFQCWLDTDDFNLFADFNNTALDTTSHNSTATGNREYVFYWHQECTVNSTFWSRDKGIQSFSQFHDGFFTQWTFVAFKG